MASPATRTDMHESNHRMVTVTVNP
jgi:hypothetical protein